MLQARDSEVWIKGWFDGDYNAIPGIKRQSGSDTETTLVKITRGRLTSIERVNGPPARTDFTPQLRQEEGVREVLLQSPDGQAWISPLEDLHLVDWESDSTASLLGGGGPRVGRLVGWAYARVRDPRAANRPQTDKPPQTDKSHQTASDESASMALREGAAQSESSSAKTTESDISAPSFKQVDGSNDIPPVASRLIEGSTEHQPPAHPCRVCSWGRALFIFVIVWVLCSIGWAFLAITPLLIRCMLASTLTPAWTARKRWHFAESALLLTFGVGAFAYLVWRALLGCEDTPISALIVLFILVFWSARIRFCWLIGLLGWMWGLSILMTCPSQEGHCRTMPDISTTADQALSKAQNKLNQIFRPDRDAQDVSGQASLADGWTRISVDEAEKHQAKFFNCTGKSDRRRDHYVIYMGESALFDLNQAMLSEASEPQLIRIGKLIQKHPQSHLIVIGHADKSPHRDGPEGNLAISERRAYAVVDWLMTEGYVKPDHIVAMGAGDRYPLFDTPGEFRGNRRVEVRVVCPGAK